MGRHVRITEKTREPKLRPKRPRIAIPPEWLSILLRALVAMTTAFGCGSSYLTHSIGLDLHAEISYK